LPPIKEEIRWLKFTPTERMMYNAYLANPNNHKFSKYLQQLCCHPQLAEETKYALSNCKTLEEIEKMMVSHYKADMDIAQEKVDKLSERIEKVDSEIKKIKKKQKEKKLKKLKKNRKNIIIEDEDEDDYINNIFNDNDLLLLIAGYDESVTMEDLGTTPTITLKNLEESLEKLNVRLIEASKILDGKKTSYEFFNNVVTRIRQTVTKETDKTAKVEFDLKLTGDTNIMELMSNDFDDFGDEDEEICGICMNGISEDDVGVTKCGHIFCYECLKIASSSTHRCPMCNKNLKENEIYILSYEKPNKKPTNLEELKKIELINLVGTKLANLILFLKETDEHTIIFSQWDDLLRKIGRILNEHGIKNVFCRGNCYQRDKAIREFNSDTNMKVIMLSSESTASGTNLTKATQVMFIDPIYGKYKYRKNQERQAIGRAHRLGQKKSIKVIRFLVKNSVEEDIYWMNVNEDKKHVDSEDADEYKEIIVE